MREALPDDVALLTLAQAYRAPELAVLLGVKRLTVFVRLAATRGRLRGVASRLVRVLSGFGAAATAVEVAERLHWKPLGD